MLEFVGSRRCEVTTSRATLTAKLVNSNIPRLRLFTPPLRSLPVPNINALQTVPALNNPVPGFSKLFFGANGDFLLAYPDGQVLEVPAALLKAVLRYASELNNTRGHPERRVRLVEPFGYRYVAHALNGDPLQPAKLPMIHSDGSITYTGAYPLHVNYPHPERVRQAMQLIDLFGEDVDAGLINTIIMRAAAESLGIGKKRRVPGSGSVSSAIKKQRNF
ncbi:hypothetical protein BJ912DRAFT_1115893 [Pholiota molesta]|nr:hypothetical protein BJ912DRAFT_1115893 [Pholiota molesta]